MFAKEGLPFMVASVLIFLVVLLIPKCLLILLAAFVVFMMFWFFRDPERISPVEEGAVVSGADGRIVEISNTELHGVPYKKISVFMNAFSVHVNRAPLQGIIEDVRHIEGSFINAAKSKASMENERNEIYMKTPFGKIVVVQVAGLIARRCVSYVKTKDGISKGDRLGMIKFSSRVDHYLPTNVTVAVGLGDKVKAGLSVIARVK